LSLDESIGKIEVDPKEEASVVEVFQDVLDKLSDVGKKDKLLKFGVEDPVKMSLSYFGPDINRMKRPPNKFLPNQKIGELMANISFDVIHLCQNRFLFVSLAVIQAIYKHCISKWFFVKSQCQSPFPLSLESWHLLKVDRVFISFMFKSVN
jgi:hypothetical protein